MAALISSFVSVSCCWMISITFVFNSSPQIIGQRCQIASSKRLIFEFRAENIDCGVCCVARSVILLKSNVFQVNIFDLAPQPIQYHCAIALVIHRNASSFFIFTRYSWIGFSTVTCGFSDPRMQQLCLLT